MPKSARPRVYRRLLEHPGLELRPQIFSKGTLTELSHVLENTVLEHRLRGAVFTGFQESGNWLQSLERYQRLVEPRARSVVVFAAGNLDTVDDDDILRVRLDDGSPLREEWFLVVLTTDFCAVLLGEDTGEPVEHEIERRFDTVLSLDPRTVDGVARFIREEVATFDEDVAARIDDALERFPPGEASHPLRDQVLGAIVSALERSRSRLADVARAEQRAAAELRALDETKNAFISAVSHELRTPLTVVHGMAATLQDFWGELPEERRASMQTALFSHAERLRVLLDDLLDVDRMVRGTLRADPQEVDLVAATLAVVSGTSNPGRVKLQAPSTLVGTIDRVQFGSIVSNLVGNAQKYAPDGDIAVTLARQDDTVLLSVDDDGPGIPADWREQAFKPFHRLDHRHPQPGTGIGLALVAEFTRLQGGRAWIEDTTGGGGTRVCVELPLSGPR